MNTVKFCVFTDIHHYPGCFFTEAPRRLKEIQQHALEENCDFIIQCGDFCHGPEHYPDFVASYNHFSIPSYHCIGNNDSENTTAAKTVSGYGLENDFYFFDQNGFRMVVMNTNYYQKDGKFYPYQDNDYRPYGGSRGWIPPHEMEWLEQTLLSSPYPCILFSHQSIERDTDAVFNAKEVQALIRRANQLQKHKVLLCINGHRHRDFLRIKDNVAYLDLNSASYDLVDIPHNCFDPKLIKQFHGADRTVIYNDPLHAIITVTEDGEIKIDGTESSFYLGISAEASGNNPIDGASRATTARISSNHFKLM